MGQGSRMGGQGGWGRGGPEYANTPRNGSMGGWDTPRTGVCKYPEDGSM